MKQFPERFEDAFFDSSFTLVAENRKHDPQYIRAESRYYDIFESIKPLLTRDQERLLFELESVHNELENIYGKYFYLQGMLDCVEWLKLIELI